ncbi:translation protein SH3-like domain-containing protein [Tricharina praecox]|uniref:translation protein SH3-like domain-containing protein n=1 Tax=Tricharina praecox TaxID=43433 RepID=UPI00221F32E7|nr:translation protein SH3-like domain-containing protein [Tricharina praecox]KAI5856475.1 translation protein SH3-like domain-containing protein [Tricharina praecox]
MSTTTPILRPLTACLKALSLRPISARTITTTATGAIVLPRKVGMVHQPAAFHSPHAASPRRHIKVYPPPQKNASKSPIADLTVQQLAVLDPLGARQKLFSRHNRDAIRVGDILQVRRGNGEQPFAGVLINIRRRGVDTAFLLRGQVTRIGVEVWFKLYSPTIEGIDLVQRAKKRAKRAKLYYMRDPKHDLGSVQNIVNQYVRQRAMLRGDGRKDGRGAGGGAKGKHRAGKR